MGALRETGPAGTAAPGCAREGDADASSPTLAEIGLDRFAPYLMNRIMGRYNASIRAEMARLGWTTPKMRALAVLSVIEAPLIRELAVHTVTDPSTLSRTLDALAADGLIRREADDSDSRAIRVILTGRGREKFEAFWPTMEGAAAQMLRGIPEDERAAFLHTLRKLLANIRKHDF